MFDYLQKFKALPQPLRDVVSDEAATAAIAALEKKYGIGLDVVVIKIMTKDIPWQAAAETLSREHNLAPDQAAALTQELAQGIFRPAARYLGIGQLAPAAQPAAAAQPAPSRATAVPHASSETDDDAAELADMQQKVKALAPAGKPATEPAVPANGWEAALAAAGITEQDTEKTERLRALARTFQKGIRDRIDTKEALKKPLEAGGLGLDEAAARAVIAALATAQPPEPAAPPRPASRAVTAVEQMRDVEYRFEPKEPSEQPAAMPPAAAEAAPISQYQIFTPAELAHELAAPAPAAVAQPAAVPAPRSKPRDTFTISAADLQQAEAALQHPPAAKQPVAVRVERMVPAAPDRPRVNDVVQPPRRLKGPLEELSSMDVATFRRLGDTPEACVEKIRQKIAVAAQEGVSQRQAAVAAWRQSPVYREYVRLGHASVKEGKSIEEIITAARAGNGNVLTPAEFNGILDLNRTVRV